MEVSADVRTIGDGCMRGEERLSYPFLAEDIGRIGEPVLGDVDRLPIRDEIHDRLIECVGHELPTEVREPSIWIFSEAVVDDVPIVVIQSDEILMRRDLIEKPGIPEDMCDFLEQGISDRFPGDDEDDLMFRDADFRIGIVFLDCVIGELVCSDEVPQNAIGGEDIFFLRRPCALQVGMRGDDVRFIERDPKFHITAECLHDRLGVEIEVFREIRMRDATFFGQPDGERPVPESDEGFDVALAKRVDDRAVVFDGLGIEDAFFGLDARPFNAESMRIVSE